MRERRSRRDGNCLLYCCVLFVVIVLADADAVAMLYTMDIRVDSCSRCVLSVRSDNTDCQIMQRKTGWIY